MRDLGEELKGLGLPKGIETSLLAKLNPAIKAIAAGRTVTAVIAIENFTRHVGAQVPQRLSAEDAADLAEFAEDVMNLLNESSAPSPLPSKPGGPKPVPETDYAPVRDSEQVHLREDYGTRTRSSPQFGKLLNPGGAVTCVWPVPSAFISQVCWVGPGKTNRWNTIF